jgi:alpha-beta hydrolase superfamily lysophospholipase
MGIEQMVNHYAELIGTPATKPIVIGHSCGGLIAQDLLADDVAAAAVAIDLALIVKGTIRYAVGNTLTEEGSDALHPAWTIPGAGRPLFEDAGANFSRHSPAKVDTYRADRGPLLLTSGTEDHTMPLKATNGVVAMHSKWLAENDCHILEGRGHSLSTTDAKTSLTWPCSGWPPMAFR